MRVGINLGSALDRRDGLNRDINYFENDPYVIKGKRTKEEAYLNYYQTLDISNLQLLNEDMIKEIKAAGFNAIRLPVTWKDHLYYIEDGQKIKNFDAFDFGYPDDLNKQMEIIDKLKIEEVWMDRVKEVVNWIIDNDMYCIINAQSDVGQEKKFSVKEDLFNKDATAQEKRIKSWIYVSDSTNTATTSDGQKISELKHEKYKKGLSVLWTEISQSFKDYGPKLLFEGFNEIRVERYPYNNPDKYLLGQGLRTDNNNVYQKELEWLNDLNSTFVNSVRNTGGNNSNRFLVVNTYLAELSDPSLRYFTVPNDPANHTIMAAHFYDHFASCTDESDEYAKCIASGGTDCSTNKNYCVPSNITLPNGVNIGTDETSDQERTSKPSTYYKLSIISKKAEELKVPVIIGEFASYLDETDDYKLDKKRVVLSHNYYLRTANYFGKQLGNSVVPGSNLNGMACFYWDDATVRFKLFNERRPRKSDLDKPLWMYPKMIDAIMKGSDNISVLLNDDPYDMSVEPEKIITNKSSVNLYVGQSEQLFATIFPSYADKNTSITWESSNSDVVSINQDGQVVGISPGFATITVKSPNNVSSIIDVQICAENSDCSIKDNSLIEVDNTVKFLPKLLIIIGITFIVGGLCVFFILLKRRKVEKM